MPSPPSSNTHPRLIPAMMIVGAAALLIPGIAPAVEFELHLPGFTLSLRTGGIVHYRTPLFGSGQEERR